MAAGVLHKLAPFPDPALSAGHEERLATGKAGRLGRRHGIGVWLYLNEPRALPLFLRGPPELRGTAQGDHAALCTSHPAVQRYLTEAVATVCRAVPDLAAFFTITASENFTHCWSHGGGGCPRCSQRDPAAVIAEVNALFHEGIRQTDSPARLTLGLGGRCLRGGDPARLPAEVALMSVSEWSPPIRRGGIESAVGSIYLRGGAWPSGQRHWELARRSGRKCLAKVQAGNTWELSAVPYIPAVENVPSTPSTCEAGVEG